MRRNGAEEDEGMVTTRATALLTRLRIPFTPHEFDHDPRVASFGAEAVGVLDVDPARVLKTLVAEADGESVVGVLQVGSMLDLKALAAAVGRKRAVLVDPRTAERRTGYVVGGISPVAQRSRLPVVLDGPAERLPTVFVSGGRRGLELELTPADLLTATGGRVAEISR